MTASRRLFEGRGQLLFVEQDGCAVTVDAVLHRPEGGGLLTTFLVRLPTRNRRRPVAALQRWEERGVTIDVWMSDGPRGPRFEMSSPEGRLVLDAGA